MTKIDIISGFLGAGKTTLIKKLLKEAFVGEQVVLIENEFGEIGIDGGFLKESGIEIREMNSGCICCSLVGDFGKSLQEVVDTYHPDRILIEPSGVGKLSDVIKAVKEVQEKISAELNSFTTVVDVTKCRIYRNNFGEIFGNQNEFAGAIILSRTDKADNAKIQESCGILRELNPKAPIITTPVDELSGEKLLETMEGGKTLEEELLAEVICPECGCLHHGEEHGHHHGEGCGHGHHHGEGCGHGHHHGEGCGHGHHHEGEDGHGHHHGEECGHGHHHGEGCGHGHHHGEGCGHGHHHGEGCGHGHHHAGEDGHGHHHAEEVFTSWGCETVRPYTEAEIEDIFVKLESEESVGTILRAKGMVAGDKEWIYFDMVPGEHEVRSGLPEYTGRICVIGSGLNKNVLAELFDVK